VPHGRIGLLHRLVADWALLELALGNSPLHSLLGDDVGALVSRASHRPRPPAKPRQPSGTPLLELGWRRVRIELKLGFLLLRAGAGTLIDQQDQSTHEAAVQGNEPQFHLGLGWSDNLLYEAAKLPIPCLVSGMP
jgi:hypothetical protein